jgi:molybdate transport system permease protein
MNALRRWLLRAVTTLIVAAGMFFFVVPSLAIVARLLGVAPADLGLAWADLWPALRLSLSTTGISMLLIVAFGTPLAYVLARIDFPFKGLLSTFIELPVVMPPVVAGLALLAAFGRRGLLGGTLEVLGISLPFTTAAVILAQTFVAAPYYIRGVQARFAGFPRDLEEAANIDGADALQTFSRVILPLSRNAILTGLLLSWARALGEFGATILFAGSLAGVTRTMPLLVYARLEQDLNTAYFAALILLGIAAMIFYILRNGLKMDRRDNEKH